MILEEDVYETCFGDGRFLYAREAFLDAPSANARLEALRAENERRTDTNVGYRYSLKAVEVERQEHQNRIVSDLKLDRDERCTLQDLIRMLGEGR